MTLKKIIFSVVSLFIIFVSAYEAKAQSDSTARHIIYNDTVYIGRYYYILTSDNQTSICKILGVSDKGILVYTDGETQSISMHDIISIKNHAIGETEVYDIKFRKKETDFIFGAGISIPTGTNSNSYRQYKSGPNIFAGIMLKLSNNVGFRGDLDYMHFERKDYIYSYTNYESVESGETLNNIAVRMNIIVGDFTQGKSNFYFSAGLGMGMSYKGPGTYRSTSTYNGTTTIYEGTYESTSEIFIIASVGFNFNYPVSPKMRIFLEPQLNTYSAFGPSYFSLRGGITF